MMMMMMIIIIIIIIIICKAHIVSIRAESEAPSDQSEK